MTTNQAANGTATAVALPGRYLTVTAVTQHELAVWNWARLT
jgi:hypothetical protein